MKAFAAIALTLACVFGVRAESAAAPQKQDTPVQIIKDEVTDGVRYVSAIPSEIVCSVQIDVEIDVKTRTILHAKFTRGCPGNAIGLCSLLEGMKVEDAITRLEGTPCAKRGTSCPDQLARVLKALKW